MKKGQINVGYKPRRIAYNNSEKLVGSAERYSTIGYDAIVAYAAKAAAVPDSSIEMAMEALFDAMNYFVLNGHSVQIPNLGTFSLSVRAKSASDAADFSANFSSKLKNIAINFLPDTTLKQMIANTAILTSVESDNYVPQGVCAITAMLFKKNMVSLPVNAGLPYALVNVTSMLFKGSRLTADYLAAVPLTIVIADADGTEHSVSLGAGYLSYRYDEMTADIKKVLASYPNAAYLKSLVVKDANNTTLIERQFAALPATPVISAITVDSNPVANGGTVGYVEGQVSRIQVFGAHLSDATVIKVGNTVETPSMIADDYMVLSYMPSATGNAPISVKSATSEASVYNLSFGAAGGTVVTTVTANGDALNNGGTTNITAGSNYNVQVAGQGLDELTTANFILPQGTTIQISNQSATLIQAVIQNAQAGDFKIRVDGTDIFTAALVAVVPTVAVTGYKLSADGATQQLSTAIQANAADGSFSCILVGSELDDLSTASFSGDGVSNLDYTPATATLTGEVSSAGQKSIVIQDNDTTIATLKVYWSGNNDDGQN